MDKAVVERKAAEMDLRSLFPLELTAFEKYFIWDDRPEQPLTSVVEMRFSTPLNVEVMERAINEVLVHNPMLRSVLEVRGSRMFWVLRDDPVKLHRPNELPFVVDGRLRGFDLQKEPGSRFWYEETAEGSRWVWQVHHAVCDGLAMRTVVIDSLLQYARLTDPANAEHYAKHCFHKRFEPTELLTRDDFGHVPQPTRKLTTWQRVKNAHYFHFQPPQVLLGSGNANARTAADDEPMIHLCMDRSFSARMEERCQASGYSLNDVATGLLFACCAEWNQQLGDRNPKSRLRFMSPYDLRGRRDLRLSASNRLSFAFIGRTYDQCRDLKQLIQSVHEEYIAMRETNLPLDFLGALEAAAKHPRLMRWGIDRSNRMATAVLSYVGDVARGMHRILPARDNVRPIGDALLTGQVGGPPARRNTNLSLAICLNWGQINFSAAWNREVLTASDCQKFLELYKSYWQRWCNEEQ